jgi:tetratricopeptide (TPR) repeat protein
MKLLNDQVIKIDPNNCYTFNNKGNSLKNLGKFNEAIECYDQAIKIYPNYCNAFYNKGISL